MIRGLSHDHTGSFSSALGGVNTPELQQADNDYAVGLLVDKVTGQREIVVRSISDPHLRIPGIIGATELGDGKPVLIVDAETLARLDRQRKDTKG